MSTAADALPMTGAPSPSTPAQRHLLAAGLLCYGFDAMDFMILTLAMPLLIAQWHLTLGEAGLLGTAGMIGVGLSALVVGWYADRYGRRPALMLSVLVFAAFTAAIALARSRQEIMVLRFLAGFGIGGVWGVITTYIKEVWPAEKRANAVSWVLSSWPLGVIAAALLASLILPAYGWRALFLCGAVASLAALYVYRFVPESPAWLAQRGRKDVAPAGDIRQIFSNGYGRNTIVATLVASFMLIAYWGINTWLPTYLVKEQGLAPSRMSLYLMVLNVGMFCGYPLHAWLANRLGKRRALILSFLVVCLMVPVYASLSNASAILMLGPVMAIGFAQTGLMGAYFPELFPTRVRSVGTGFCFNVGRGAAAFAPFALGQLATTFGLGRSIALCGIGYLVAGLLMILLPEQPPHSTDDV